jgi:hypothetical protein
MLNNVCEKCSIPSGHHQQLTKPLLSSNGELSLNSIFLKIQTISNQCDYWLHKLHEGITGKGQLV